MRQGEEGHDKFISYSKQTRPCKSLLLVELASCSELPSCVQVSKGLECAGNKLSLEHYVYLLQTVPGRVCFEFPAVGAQVPFRKIELKVMEAQKIVSLV